MKKTAKYIFLLSVLLALWNTYIIKPVKIVTMFLHEVGHVIMTFIFGNKIVVFNFSLKETGHVIMNSKEWFPTFMIANGGYIASLVFAVLIFKLRDTKFNKAITGSLAIGILFLMIKYGKVPTTFLYAVIYTILVILIYIINNDKIFDWANDIIGMSCIAYCIYETLVNTIFVGLNFKFDIFKNFANVKMKTDSVVLGEITFIPAMIWGAVWLLVSITVLMSCMKNSKKKRSYR